MKILSVILNLTATTGYLKNPLAETTSFAQTFNTVTEIATAIFGVFLIGMLVFSVFKFTSLVTPEKKVAARNQVVVIAVFFAILMVQITVENISNHYVETWIAKIIAAGVALVLLGSFYYFFMKKVQITSAFKLYE